MTSEQQINLLGEPDRPEDLQLGVVQREVVRVLRRLGNMSKDEAGALAHAHRGKHTVSDRCAFCGVDGAPILRSLIDRGLAVKGVDGTVRPAEPLKPDPAFGVFPEGF